MIGILITVAHPIAQETSLKGKLLIAAPKMPAGAFTKSVILVIEHDASGAFGLIVNKPETKVSKAQLFRKLELPETHATDEIIVFYGGPVQREVGFVIHNVEFEVTGTRRITETIAISAERPVIEAMARGDGPDRYLFIVGYAGWAAQQLEGEMRREDWLTAPIDDDIVFDENHRTKWERTMDARYRNL